MRKYLKSSWLTLCVTALVLTNGMQAQGHGEHENENEITENTQEPAATDESVAEDLEEKAFDPTPVVMEHIQDAHGFHVYGEGHDAVTVPLPVILWTDKGLVAFMSSAFHHDNKGHHVVERRGMRFVNLHENIYQLEEGAEHLEFDADRHPVNASMPLDFSITKNVFTILLAALILCLIFLPVAARYKKGHGVPKGLASFMEPLVVFVRDDIAIPNIGKKKHERFMPLLLTMFFLIWSLNLIGLIPFFPFSANMSGNIAFTMVLAIITLIVTNASGNKSYLRHIFWPPGVPVWLMPIMIPVEIIGVFTKPFALMIRLFANITAGHIIVLSLISLIFIFKSVVMAAVSVPFALFISVLELLVAALQAYIFTMLTALFIGTAVAEDHH